MKIGTFMTDRYIIILELQGLNAPVFMQAEWLYSTGFDSKNSAKQSNLSTLSYPITMPSWMLSIRFRCSQLHWRPLQNCFRREVGEGVWTTAELQVDPLAWSHHRVLLLSLLNRCSCLAPVPFPSQSRVLSGREPPVAVGNSLPSNPPSRVCRPSDFPDSDLGSAAFLWGIKFYSFEPDQLFGGEESAHFYSIHSENKESFLASSSPTGKQMWNCLLQYVFSY